MIDKPMVKLAICHFLLALAAIVALFVADAYAQTCDLRNAASLGGCDNIYYGWFTSRNDVVSQTLVYGDGFSPIINASVRSYSRTGVGCGFHSRVTITQTYANGQTCSTSESDNHNRPCDQCGSSLVAMDVQNAANGRTYANADSLAAGYALNISTVTAQATSKTLPTSLGGVEISVDGIPAGIIYVSPLQINFHIPESIQAGLRSVRAQNAAGVIFFGDIFITNPAPGVFMRGDGSGIAAADYGNGYIALYVTGINAASLALADITLQTNNQSYHPVFIEPKPSQFIGVTQLNFLNVPASGQGAVLIVQGASSNGFILRR